MDTGNSFQPTTLFVRSQDAAAWETKSGDATFQTIFQNWMSYYGVTVDTTKTYRYGKDTSVIRYDPLEPIRRPKGVRVNRVVIPDTMPTFSAANNVLKCIAISKNHPSVAHVEFNITLPLTKRYLNYADIASEINTQVSAQNALFSCTVDGNGILTLASATAATHYLRVSESNKKLGMDYPPVEGSSINNIIAPSPIVLSPTRVAYIRSRTLGVTSGHMTNEHHDILAMIPCHQDVNGFGGSIVYNNPNTQTYLNIKQKMYDTLDFELLDENLTQINLRRHDWHMELSFVY